jgi:hypothetical protein
MPQEKKKMGIVIHLGFKTLLVMTFLGLVVLYFVDPATFAKVLQAMREIFRSIH